MIPEQVQSDKPVSGHLPPQCEPGEDFKEFLRRRAKTLRQRAEEARATSEEPLPATLPMPGLAGPNLPPVESVNQDLQTYQNYQDQPAGCVSAPDWRGDKGAVEEENRGGAFELPFLEFLGWALAENEADIRRHFNEPGNGVWRSSLFHFVRLVMGHISMRDEDDPRSAFQVVEATFQESKGGLPWSGLGLARAEACSEFFGVWMKVRCRAGASILGQAHHLAKRYPLDLPRSVIKRRPDGYPEFISLAGWLQVVVGARPMWLAEKNLAELMSVTTTTISRYRRWASEDGFVRYHKRYGGKRGWADEFYFNIGLFPELEERAETGTAELFER